MEPIARLSESIKFKTVAGNWSEFLKFHQFLHESFPLVHRELELVKINDYSLLYHWRGKTSESILLLAHTDVVPASEDGWEVPPFSGAIKDGFVWGRGTLDDKSSVMAILEAVEKLIAEGFQPKRTVYIAFGCDEETKGYLGACATARYLSKQNIKIDAILDEGAAIVRGIFPKIDRPFALVGVAEKGYASFDLVAKGEGGHSSAPKRNSPVERMAKAIQRISEYRSKVVLSEPVEEFLKTCGKFAPFPASVVLKHPRIFVPLIERIFRNVPSANAMLRTTMCVTLLNAGVADNVIPDTVTATVNTRIIPGETAEQVFQRLGELVKDLEIEVVKNEKWEISDPVPCSSLKGEFFNELKKTINEVFPQAIVTPFLTIGGTDSRHYKSICSNIYRFSPVEMSTEEMSLVHGKNERISIEKYLKMIDFYQKLLLKI